MAFILLVRSGRSSARGLAQGVSAVLGAASGVHPQRPPRSRQQDPPFALRIPASTALAGRNHPRSPLHSIRLVRVPAPVGRSRLVRCLSPRLRTVPVDPSHNHPGEHSRGHGHKEPRQQQRRPPIPTVKQLGESRSHAAGATGRQPAQLTDLSHITISKLRSDPPGLDPEPRHLMAIPAMGGDSSTRCSTTDSKLEPWNASADNLPSGLQQAAIPQPWPGQQVDDEQGGTGTTPTR